jgi:hypothetical protein
LSDVATSTYLAIVGLESGHPAESQDLSSQSSLSTVLLEEEEKPFTNDIDLGMLKQKPKTKAFVL